MKNYSYDAFLNFFAYAAEKGLINASTTRALRTTVSRMQPFLSPEEVTDVRLIDPDTTFDQFQNRNSQQFSPGSMLEYRRRLHRALKEFVAFTDDPGSYRPKSRIPSGTGNHKKKSALPVREDPTGASAPNAATSAVPQDGLRLPFPLREGFLAEVLVPRDMTSEEAKRMGAFLRTLALDFAPE